MMPLVNLFVDHAKYKHNVAVSQPCLCREDAWLMMRSSRRVGRVVVVASAPLLLRAAALHTAHCIFNGKSLSPTTGSS